MGGQLEDFDKKHQSTDKAIKVLTVLLQTFLSKTFLWEGIGCNAPVKGNRVLTTQLFPAALLLVLPLPVQPRPHF